jgi:hypothetical protein
MPIDNRERIWFESIKSSGTFPDGRIKLDVLFRGSNNRELVWTPPWNAVIELSATAKFLEETNKPRSEWNQPLTNAYSKLEQATKLLENIANAANLIAANLGNLFGDKAIDKLFPAIPPDLSHKPEQIRYILSGAEDIDDFIVRLTPIISVHEKNFNDKVLKQNFNRILKPLNLKLDDNMNIVKL